LAARVGKLSKLRNTEVHDTTLADEIARYLGKFEHFPASGSSSDGDEVQPATARVAWSRVGTSGCSSDGMGGSESFFGSRLAALELRVQQLAQQIPYLESFALPVAVDLGKEKQEDDLHVQCGGVAVAAAGLVVVSGLLAVASDGDEAAGPALPGEMFASPTGEGITVVVGVLAEPLVGACPGLPNLVMCECICECFADVASVVKANAVCDARQLLKPNLSESMCVCIDDVYTTNDIHMTLPDVSAKAMAVRAVGKGISVASVNESLSVDLDGLEADSIFSLRGLAAGKAVSEATSRLANEALLAAGLPPVFTTNDFKRTLTAVSAKAKAGRAVGKGISVASLNESLSVDLDGLEADNIFSLRSSAAVKAKCDATSRLVREAVLAAGFPPAVVRRPRRP
jgi:hypothetical protein